MKSNFEIFNDTFRSSQWEFWLVITIFFDWCSKYKRLFDWTQSIARTPSAHCEIIKAVLCTNNPEHHGQQAVPIASCCGSPHIVCGDRCFCSREYRHQVGRAAWRHLVCCLGLRPHSWPKQGKKQQKDIVGIASPKSSSYLQCCFCLCWLTFLSVPAASNPYMKRQPLWASPEPYSCFLPLYTMPGPPSMRG